MNGKQTNIVQGSDKVIKVFKINTHLTYSVDVRRQEGWEINRKQTIAYRVDDV